MIYMVSDSDKNLCLFFESKEDADKHASTYGAAAGVSVEPIFVFNKEGKNKDLLSSSEALYGFCGWLTSREEKVVMSKKHNCAGIADLINEFCTENSLPEPRDGWHEKLKHPSSGTEKE